MDKNAGLMRCNEPVGHHDALVHAWGYLKSSPNPVVLDELRQAVTSAANEGYIIPEFMVRGLAIPLLFDIESPF